MLLTLLLARCSQYDAVRLQSVSCDTSLVASNVCLLMAEKTAKCLTRNLNVMPKTTKQHLIARSDKSVANVTNNKRLCSTFCTIEANY